MARNKTPKEEKIKEIFGQDCLGGGDVNDVQIDIEIETNTKENNAITSLQVAMIDEDAPAASRMDPFPPPSLQSPGVTSADRTPESQVLLPVTTQIEKMSTVEGKLPFSVCNSSSSGTSNNSLLTYSENPRDMKVLRLREELKSRNLSPSGLKNALVHRLIKALQEEGYNTTGFATEDENSECLDEESCTFTGTWWCVSPHWPCDDSSPSDHMPEESDHLDVLSSTVPPISPAAGSLDNEGCPKNKVGAIIGNGDSREPTAETSTQFYRLEHSEEDDVASASVASLLASSKGSGSSALPPSTDTHTSDSLDISIEEPSTLPLISDPPSFFRLPAHSFSAMYSSSSRKIHYINSEDWKVRSFYVQDKCLLRALRSSECDHQAGTSLVPGSEDSFEKTDNKRQCPLSGGYQQELPQLNLKGFSATLQGTKIVIFGGSKKVPHTVFYNTCYVYDTETLIWKKLNVKEGDFVPLPRDFHIACSVGSNEILIAGGRTLLSTATGAEETFQCLNDAHILDIISWKWRPIAPEGYLKPRFGHVAIYHPRHHSVFIHGGLHIIEGIADSADREKEDVDGTGDLWEANFPKEPNEEVEELADVVILNLDMMKWTTVDSLYEVGVLPRVHHTACLRNGKIFLYGGCNAMYGNIFTPNDVRYFEIDTLHWHKLPTDREPCRGRWGHAAFMINEEMVIMGGYLSEHEPTKTVLVINTEYRPAVVICESILMNNMRQLLQSELLADVNFRVQNKYLRAHKAIIACRGNQLRDLCNKKKKRGQTITLESIKHQTFSFFLQLLYSGRVIVDQASHEPLTELLDTYKLVHKSRRLRQKCEYLFSLPSVSLEALLRNPMYFDIYLRVEDTYFPAHRSILSARSSYFMNLIQECQSTEPTPVIQLSSVKVQHCQIILEFIYAGHPMAKHIADLVPSNQVQLICDLLRHANTFKVIELKQYCEKAVTDNWLCAETAANFYEIASHANSETLKRCSVYVLASKLKNINFKANYLLQCPGNPSYELELAVRQEISRQLRYLGSD